MPYLYYTATFFLSQRSIIEKGRELIHDHTSGNLEHALLGYRNLPRGDCFAKNRQRPHVILDATLWTFRRKHLLCLEFSIISSFTGPVVFPNSLSHRHISYHRVLIVLSGNGKGARIYREPVRIYVESRYGTFGRIYL